MKYFEIKSYEILRKGYMKDMFDDACFAVGLHAACVQAFFDGHMTKSQLDEATEVACQIVEGKHDLCRLKARKMALLNGESTICGKENR